MVVLKDLRPVHVVGVGMHRYEFPGETNYIDLGLTAVRAALADCGVPFEAVETAFVGTTGIGMAAGRVMFSRLGSTGLSVTQVENASASGSSAFQLACRTVAAGFADVAIAVGVDKHGDQLRAVNKAGIEHLSVCNPIPLVEFALLGEWVKQSRGVTQQDLALVAAKNHTNAASNPFAQFQKPRSVDDILASKPVAGDLTALMCTPRGDGGAAAIVMSEDAIRRFGVRSDRPVRVTSSVLCSETERQGTQSPTVAVARTVAQRALAEAQSEPRDLDVVELHDAFATEEILYSETFGICPEGAGHLFLREGGSAIGGACAINSSGGLIAQGHPLGPTGIGQIHEIVRQLRGENAERQQPGAKVGMAHMIGLGTIAIAHVLERN
ncbi:thiolase family protein [Aliihoeflea sp. PC F10.4]